jgi:YD repeat-containing protein
MLGMPRRLKRPVKALRLLCGLALGLLTVNLCVAATATYGYDANGRPNSITYDNGVVITYGMDANGNRTTVTLTGNVTPPWWSRFALFHLDWAYVRGRELERRHAERHCDNRRI